MGPSVNAAWTWSFFAALVLTFVPGTPPAEAMLNAVEARGAVYPSDSPTPAPRETSTMFAGGRVGTEERACVLAPDFSLARSGEWQFTPMGYAATWNPAREAIKTAWGPLHQPEDPTDTPLRLLATNLTPPFARYEVIVPFPASGIEDGERKYFYAVGDLVLPGLGAWAVEATSGPNWGCFVITLDEVQPLEE